jgi:hypothetical protein
MKTILATIVIAAFSHCCLAESPAPSCPALDDEHVYIAVLEDQSLEPAGIAALHAEIAALGMEYARPLKGRLNDQGSLWQAPEGMTYAEAAQALSPFSGVVGTADPEQPANPGEPHIGEGSLLIVEEHEDDPGTRAALRALGFCLQCDDCDVWHRFTGLDSFLDAWRYFPREYLIHEACDAARAVPGVELASPGMVPCPTCDREHDYVAVLEDQSLEPDQVTALHAQIAALRLAYSRPLKGRLEGQGNLWQAPEGMTYAEAAQAVGSLQGVLAAADPRQDAEWTHPDILDGSIAVVEEVEDDDETRTALMDLGLCLGSEDNGWWTPYGEDWFNDHWHYFTREYSVSEVVDAVRAVPGVEYAAVGWVMYQCEGDVTGDGTVNIFDLIFVRNHLNEDPLSGDVWHRADVNRDGRINVLDLIVVRNNL